MLELARQTRQTSLTPMPRTSSQPSNDYGSGSKDYLSYRVLGTPISEGKLKRFKIETSTSRVGEVAKRGYGQFSENPRTISLARFSFPPAPSLLGSKSSANRLRITGTLARKIRWDKPVSEIAREFIFSRRALTGVGDFA